jgi:type IV secretory pathway VirJ component
VTRLRTLLWLIAGIGLAAAAGAPAWAASPPGSRYSEVHVSDPAGAMRGIVILFPDLSGWSDADRQAAALLAQHDMLVVGVDTGLYAETLARLTETCHQLVADAETISRQLQREQHSGEYFTPIMAGTGQGGALAEQVLAEAPSDTIAGAVSIDPAPTLDVRLKPCPPDPAMMRGPGLPGFWGVGATADLPAAIQARVSALLRLGTKIDTHVFAHGIAESEMLLALTQPHLDQNAPNEEDVSELPLVALPAAHPNGMLAIVLSGIMEQLPQDWWRQVRYK